MCPELHHKTQESGGEGPAGAERLKGRLSFPFRRGNTLTKERRARGGARSSGWFWLVQTLLSRVDLQTDRSVIFNAAPLPAGGSTAHD